MSKKQTLVVIGNGMVGHTFLSDLMASEIKDQYQVVTFCEEPRVAYDRVHLTEYFSGKTAEDLSMVEEDFFTKHNITLHLGDKAESIDLEKKIIHSSKNITIHYDKLVLATGSFPFVPPIPGHDRKNCMVYRTIEDLEAITDAAKDSTIGAVVGGGLLGLEAAKALKDLGLKTNVIQFSPRLMSAQLDDGGAKMLADKIEAIGISVLANKNTLEIVDGEQCKNKMIFADGEELETDLVVFSTGIRPRDEIARKCGLKLGTRGGIAIDDQCKTSDPNVYAIGECAVWNEQIFGLVAPGYAMGRTVIAGLSGQFAQFTGADMSTKLKLNGVDVASIGDAHAVTQGALVYTYQNGSEGIYKRLVVSENGKKLLGAVLVGDASGYGTLLQYCLNGIDLPENPDALILPHRSDESVGLGPDALPASAQICSCFDVSKGQICSAIEAGCMSIGELKTETKAASGCGGCAALLKSVLDSELESAGIAVNTDLCEHFPHTRRDLYNIVMVEDIKTFDQLIERHGSGRGCEICRQAVGSILASYWNEYILEKNHLSLQDTNDNFLANMQKDGTYSVVPRMTGGEVTPVMLIALGEVAKKYNLYTKVSGGQRIVMFGARVDQLPTIWEELITAGFESGHAYGKSLRTVKSCGELVLIENNTSLMFEQNSSIVYANVSGIEGKPSLIQYTHEVSPVVDLYAPSDNEIAKILSLSEKEIDNKKYSTRLVSCGFPYLVVPVFKYESVRKARFNFSVWSQSSAPQTAAQEILLISPKTPFKDSDFAVRLLGPNIGVHQDPPVGSTMASFASYLCSFDFMRKGTYTYAVERGDDTVRRSVLNLELDHKGEQSLTIRVAGEAVMVADATMFIPS